MFTNTVLCTLCGLAVWADKNPLFFNVHEYNITQNPSLVKAYDTSFSFFRARGEPPSLKFFEKSS